MVWETYACVDNTRGMMKTGKHGPCVGLCVLLLLVVVCVVSCLLCSVWRNTWCGVVLGVLVVIVAGSRPVVLFEPGC